jgi:hypothetical protein
VLGRVVAGRVSRNQGRQSDERDARAVAQQINLTVTLERADAPTPPGALGAAIDLPLVTLPRCDR